MKKTIAISVLLLTMVNAACKKDRQCECKNSNGTYIAGDVTATKMQAKKICKDLSTSTTDCYLK